MSAVSEQATPGLLNALNKNRNRMVCPDCGFPVPVYPGRYPSKCPMCDRPIDRQRVGDNGDMNKVATGSFDADKTPEPEHQGPDVQRATATSAQGLT